MKKLLLLFMGVLCALNSAWADTTVFSYDGSGSTTSVSATVGTCTLTGSNNSFAKQKGNWTMKCSKTLSSSDNFKITPTQALSGGETITLGNYISSSKTQQGQCLIEFYDSSNNKLTSVTGTLINNGDANDLQSDETPADESITVPSEAQGATYILVGRNSGLSGATTLYISKFIISAVTATTAPSITTNLSATADVTVGVAKSFSIVASGASSYQWYKNSSNSTDGATAIDGATSATYSYTASAEGTEYIYCAATNTIGTTNSAICAVTATEASEPTPGSVGSIKTVDGTTTTWDFTAVTADQAATTEWTQKSDKKYYYNKEVTDASYITPSWCEGIAIGLNQSANADKTRIYYDESSGICFNGGAGSIKITIPEGANTLEVYSAQTLLTNTSGVTLTAIDGGYIATNLTAGTVVEIHRNSGATYVTKVITKYTEATTYAITKGTHENGDFTISPEGEQLEGTQITLTATPAEGYTLSSWDVYKTGDETTKVTVTNNKFTMPAYPVTVTATFAEYQEPAEVDFTIDFRSNPYTISGTYLSATTVTSGSFNDAQHGYKAPVASIPVPGSVQITVGTCQYGSDMTITVKNGDETVGSAAGKTSSCSEVTFTYTGEATTLSVTCGNYCPYIKVKTISAEDIATKNNNRYEVTANSARNLKACITAAASDATDKVVYIPNGTYDFGTEENITISGSGIAIIGESMEGVIIKNTPATESLKKALFKNTGTGNLFQNLTLQSYAPWGGNAERAHALWDEGNQTVCKNVYLKGYQDTYFSNNTNCKYFEGGKIEGTTDFICGGGKIFFDGVELICTTSANKTSGDVIIAPQAETHAGTQFVFNNCTIKSTATYYLGRSWNGTNTAIFAACTKENAYISAVNPSPAASGTLEISEPTSAVNVATLLGEWNPQTIIAPFNSITKNINETSKYAAFSARFNTVIPEGVTAYKGVVQGESIILTALTGSVIPANTGVILYKENGGDVVFAGTTDAAETVEGNELVATSKTEYSVIPTSPEGKSWYALKKTEASFIVINDGTALNRNSCYISGPAYSNGAKALTVVIDDATAINAVKTNASTSVRKAIVNGRLVIMTPNGNFTATGAQVK